MTYVDGRGAQLKYAGTAIGLVAACWSVVGPSVQAETDGRRDVRHLTEWTTVEVGATRVIAFELTDPTDRDLRPSWSVGNPMRLEVPRAPEVLAGEHLGFLRVRGLSAGRTTLRVRDVALEVRVVEPHATAGRPSSHPIITGPAEGAVVWGQFAVGVEHWVEGEEDAELRLRLPDDSLIEPSERTGPEQGPWRYARFDVHTHEIAPGDLSLVPLSVREGEVVSVGAAVRVRLVEPDDAALLAGEAEDEYEIELPETPAGAALRRVQQQPRSLGQDDDASAGVYFACYAPLPAPLFPVAVERAGRYQLVVRAAGTLAGGAYPTIAVIVDGVNDPVTNGSVLGTGWHRAAIGVPFPLEPGVHVITPLFANDLYVPRRVDRNLMIDRIELLRVGDAESDAESDAAMMMAGGMAPGPTSRPAGGASRADGHVTSDDPFDPRPRAIRVAFNRQLDGLPIAGALRVEGRCWSMAEDALDRPVPLTTLIVNGRPVGAIRSPSPSFPVDTGHFEPGRNTVQLVARDAAGRRAASPIQAVWYDPAIADASRPAPRFHRFEIDDFVPADEGPEPGTLVADVTTFADAEARLELPAAWSGAHRIFAEMWSRETDGAGPRLEVILEHDDDARTLRRLPVPRHRAPHWGERPMNLPAGPKTLVLRFRAGEGDAPPEPGSAWLSAVGFVPVPAIADRRPPIVKMLYPPDDHEAWMADVVIAEVADDTRTTRVELLVDGVETGIAEEIDDGPGQVVLPLPLRDLAPGPHDIALVAWDDAENRMVGPPRRVVIPAEAPSEPGRYARAVRLLDRFAFGPGRRELAGVLLEGELAWLRSQLRGGVENAAERSALATALAHMPGTRDPYQASVRALAQSMLSPNSVRSRFVLWAQNHFSTWLPKVEARKWPEHLAFSRLGVARFRDLLNGSAHSPAMLRYLDQDESVAGRINENFAREIMELHSLGVDGGYTQDDVTGLARLLSGWTASVEGDGRSPGGLGKFTFRFDPKLCDGDGGRWLGVALDEATPGRRYDRVRLVLETLAAHPSTASFIARKLARHYVAAVPPEDLVDDLARVYLETDGDTAAMLEHIAGSEAFWRGDRDRIVTPLEYTLRLTRTARHANPWGAAEFLQRCGMPLFGRPSPDGYPDDDAAYVDTNVMVQRWRYAEEMSWSVRELVPGPLMWGSQEIADDQWAQTVVDVLAIRLTGRLLGPESNDSALRVMDGTKGPRNERVDALAAFLARLPEMHVK